MVRCAGHWLNYGHSVASDFYERCIAINLGWYLKFNYGDVIAMDASYNVYILLLLRRAEMVRLLKCNKDVSTFQV